MFQLECFFVLLLSIVTVIVCYTSDMKVAVYERAAIASRDPICGKAAMDMISAGGHAVDAAVAHGFCLGVTRPLVLGIGGGNFMIIYDGKTKEITALDARETAPLKSTTNMYVGNPRSAKKGALAIGVPGEVAGYWAAHQKYGKLPWKQLLQPAIKSCREGSEVNNYLESLLKWYKRSKMDNPAFRSIYTKPISSDTLKEGDRCYVGETLCKTLETIAEEGRDGFYKGSVAEKMVEDIQKEGGIITVEDLKAYRTVWRIPLQFNLTNGLRYVSLPPPSGGVVVGFILKVLQNYNFTAKDLENTVLTYHRFAEAQKFAFAQRTKLGDEDFHNVTKMVDAMMCSSCTEAIWRLIDDSKTFTDPQHYGVYGELTKNTGTAHYSIIGDDGSAVAVTSSINSPLGSGIQSSQTGVIFNNHMNDFSKNNKIPTSPSNLIVPGKRPLSSMSPSLIIDKNKDVVLVTGAAGGGRILSAIAPFIARLLWFKQDLKTATLEPRIYPQLTRMRLRYGRDMEKELVNALKKKGHRTKRLWSVGALFSIYKQNGRLYAYGEPRRDPTTNGL